MSLAELLAEHRGVRNHMNLPKLGGGPRPINLDVTPVFFAAVRKGRMTVPLGKQPDLAVVADLPWGSIATVHSPKDRLYRIAGPPIWQTDK
jgi:hypothetical protein